MSTHLFCFPFHSESKCVLGRGTILAFTLAICASAGATVAQAVADEYYGTAKSKVYHSRRACPSGRKIKLENRVTFSSKADAESQGRRLCRFCSRLEEKEKAAKDRVPPAEKDGGAETPTRHQGRTEDHPHTAIPLDHAAKAGFTPAKDLPQDGTVKNVSPDGTVELVSGDRVRLLGLCCLQRCRAVTRTIQDQTADRKVSLVYDSAQAHCGHRDATGRLWAYIQVDPDDRDVGAELIFRGAAWLDREIPFGRRNTYIAREDQAWWAGRGVWKRLKGADGNREVVVGRYGSHYYPVGSPWIVLLTDPTTITVNEAKSRRLTPCQDARPTSKKKSRKKKRGARKAQVPTDEKKPDRKKVGRGGNASKLHLPGPTGLQSTTRTIPHEHSPVPVVIDLRRGLIAIG